MSRDKCLKLPIAICELLDGLGQIPDLSFFFLVVADWLNREVEAATNKASYLY